RAPDPVPGARVGVSAEDPAIGAVAGRLVVAAAGDAERAAVRIQLPQPAQHVDGIERAVVEVDAPGVGVALAADTQAVDEAARQIAGKSCGYIQRYDATVVVRGIQDLLLLVHPEVVRPGAVRPRLVEVGHLVRIAQVGDVYHVDQTGRADTDAADRRAFLPDEQILLLVGVRVPEPPAVVHRGAAADPAGTCHERADEHRAQRESPFDAV